jgi:hypothetical protein
MDVLNAWTVAFESKSCIRIEGTYARPRFDEDVASAEQALRMSSWGGGIAVDVVV